MLLLAIELDDHDEQAWLWLSSVVESPADKRVCLENVLAINPDNRAAQKGLRWLDQHAPVVMLNLMRFREKSLDGNGSGWDAYLRYSNDGPSDRFSLFVDGELVGSAGTVAILTESTQLQRRLLLDTRGAQSEVRRRGDEGELGRLLANSRARFVHVQQPHAISAGRTAPVQRHAARRT